jgi:hypothetical protein
VRREESRRRERGEKRGVTASRLQLRAYHYLISHCSLSSLTAAAPVRILSIIPASSVLSIIRASSVLSMILASSAHALYDTRIFCSIQPLPPPHSTLQPPCGAYALNEVL